MNNTIFNKKNQTKFLNLAEEALKNNSISAENNEDFKFYAREFLKNNVFVRTSEAWYYYEHNVWKLAGPKDLIERAAFIHPVDTAKHRQDIVSMAGSILRPGPSIPFDEVLLEEEIPFKEVVLNVLTKELRPLTQDDYVTTFIPHNYNPEAKCPLWEKCVKQWLNNEQILILQEFFGYILSGRTNMKKTLILYGESGAGKSRPLFIAKYMVGHNNSCTIDPKDMRNPNIMAQIYGKKLNVKDELGDDSKLGDGFRVVIDGGTIPINEKFKPRISITPTAKHIFATNVLPKMGNNRIGNDANIERLLLLEFKNKLQEMDRNLIYKLNSEIEGIINWATEGLVRLIQNREFTKIKASDKLIENYRTEYSSNLEIFIKNECESHDSYEIENHEFIKNYQNYLFKGGLLHANEKYSTVEIGRQISALGFTSCQKSIHGKRSSFYKGLRIKQEQDQKEIEKIVNKSKQNPNFLPSVN